MADTYKIIDVLDKLETLVAGVDGIDRVIRGQVDTRRREPMTTAYIVTEDFFAATGQHSLTFTAEIIVSARENAAEAEKGMQELLSRIYARLLNSDGELGCAIRFTRGGIAYGMQNNLVAPITGSLLYEMDITGPVYVPDEE